MQGNRYLIYPTPCTCLPLEVTKGLDRCGHVIYHIPLLIYYVPSDPPLRVVRPLRRRDISTHQLNHRAALSTFRLIPRDLFPLYPCMIGFKVYHPLIVKACRHHTQQYNRIQSIYKKALAWYRRETTRSRTPNLLVTEPVTTNCSSLNLNRLLVGLSNWSRHRLCRLPCHHSSYPARPNNSQNQLAASLVLTAMSCEAPATCT